MIAELEEYARADPKPDNAEAVEKVISYLKASLRGDCWEPKWVSSTLRVVLFKE